MISDRNAGLFVLAFLTYGSQTVPVNMLTELLSRQIAEYEVEFCAYTEQTRRGSDVFENARAASFFSGKIEALQSVIEILETQVSDVSAVCSDTDCIPVT